MSVPPATLSTNGQKARFGVSYVRSICNQAGVGLVETAPDEDVLAVDCLINFDVADVRVQVKCTSSRKLPGGRTVSWPVEERWLTQWRKVLVPVYLVLVIVPEDPAEWIEHSASSTVHHAAAFWCRIKPTSTGPRISIDKSQRLTAATIGLWHQDLVAAFGVPPEVSPRRLMI